MYFIVLDLILRSLIQFELIFIDGDKLYSFADDFLIFPALFIDESFFFPLCGFGFFAKIICPDTYDFISGLSVLLHWSVCVLFCQVHSVLTIVALHCSLKSGSVMPPAQLLFFFFSFSSSELLWLVGSFLLLYKADYFCSIF